MLRPDILSLMHSMRIVRSPPFTCLAKAQAFFTTEEPDELSPLELSSGAVIRHCLLTRFRDFCASAPTAFTSERASPISWRTLGTGVAGPSVLKTRISSVNGHGPHSHGPRPHTLARSHSRCLRCPLQLPLPSNLAMKDARCAPFLYLALNN